MDVNERLVAQLIAPIEKLSFIVAEIMKGRVGPHLWHVLSDALRAAHLAAEGVGDGWRHTLRHWLRVLWCLALTEGRIFEASQALSDGLAYVAERVRQGAIVPRALPAEGGAYPSDVVPAY